MELPWREQTKPRHQRQEQRLGKSQGGKSHPASGRLWRWKRDGRLFDFLIEARDTESGAYSVSLKEWKTIEKEAHMTPPGLLPAIQIDIQDTSLIVIDLHIFTEMKNRLIAEEESG